VWTRYLGKGDGVELRGSGSIGGELGRWKGSRVKGNVEAEDAIDESLMDAEIRLWCEF
jgi:hypothetical protein